MTCSMNILERVYTLWYYVFCSICIVNVYGFDDILPKESILLSEYSKKLEKALS